MLRSAKKSKQRVTPQRDSHYSWTVDFATRRAKAREDMQPMLTWLYRLVKRTTLLSRHIDS